MVSWVQTPVAVQAQQQACRAEPPPPPIPCLQVILITVSSSNNNKIITTITILAQLDRLGGLGLQDITEVDLEALYQELTCSIWLDLELDT